MRHCPLLIDLEKSPSSSSVPSRSKRLLGQSCMLNVAQNLLVLIAPEVWIAF